MITKKATFGSIQDRLRNHLEATRAGKTASSIPTGQVIEQEQGVPLPGSDAEVKELLPSGGNPGDATTSDLTATGVGVGEKLPGVSTSLPTQEKERKEVSPETKLAAVNPDIAALQDRLGANIAKAAAAFVKKVAGDDKPADGSLGNTTKADTSGTPASIPEVSGVTDAKVVSGAGAVPTKQGPEEKAPEEKLAADGQVDLEELSKKVALYAHDMEIGRALVHDMVGTIAGMSNPLLHDARKLAASVEESTMISTATAMVSAGVEHSIITSKQAGELMALLGFKPNPLYTAIEDVQQKMAAVYYDQNLDDSQKIAFIKKCASPEEAVEAAGGQPPVNPEEMQAAIQQLLQELQAAVESGQITEEQALQILQEQGVPVEEMLAEAMAAEGGGGEAPVAVEAPEIGGADPQMAMGAPAPQEAPAAPTPEPEPEKKEEGGEDEDGEKKKEAARHEAGLKVAEFLSHRKQAQAIFLGADGTTTGAPSSVANKYYEYAKPKASSDIGSSKITGVAEASARNSKIQGMGRASGAAGAPPKTMVEKGSINPAIPATYVRMPSEIVASATKTPGVNLPEPDPNVAEKKPSILPWIIGGLGLGGAGIAAYHLTKDDDEEEDDRRRRSKMGEASDPAMAATETGAAEGAMGGEAPTLEELLAKLEEAVQVGAITPEEAQEVVQILLSGGGEGEIPPVSPEELQAAAIAASGGSGGVPAAPQEQVPA